MNAEHNPFHHVQPSDPFLSTTTAGKILGGISSSTVLRLIRAGELQAIRPGRRQWLVRKSACLEHLRQRSSVVLLHMPSAG